MWKIKITRKAFKVKKFMVIASESDFRLYNLWGLGLWLFKGMSRAEIRQYFKEVR